MPANTGAGWPFLAQVARICSILSEPNLDRGEELMSTTLIIAGVASLMAAIVGGGLKAFGVEVPIVTSSRRQLLLGLFGVLLLGGGLTMDHANVRESNGTLPAIKLSGTTWTGTRTYLNNGLESTLEVKFEAHTATTLQNLGMVGAAQGADSVTHEECRWNVMGRSIKIDCPADRTRIGGGPYNQFYRHQETLSLTANGSSMSGSMTSSQEPQLFLSRVSHTLIK